MLEYNEISTKYIESAIALEEKNKQIKKLKERLKESQLARTIEKPSNLQMHNEVEELFSEENLKLTERLEIDNEKNKIIRSIVCLKQTLIKRILMI